MFLVWQVYFSGFSLVITYFCFELIVAGIYEYIVRERAAHERMTKAKVGQCACVQTYTQKCMWTCAWTRIQILASNWFKCKQDV